MDNASSFVVDIQYFSNINVATLNENANMQVIYLHSLIVNPLSESSRRGTDTKE